jgi:hypothetical protein
MQGSSSPVAKRRKNMAASKLDPFEKLLKLCSRSVEQVPAGWYTTQQMQQGGGGSVYALSAKLSSLAETGLIESRKFRVKLSNGRVTSVIHYKIKD